MAGVLWKLVQSCRHSCKHALCPHMWCIPIVTCFSFQVRSSWKLVQPCRYSWKYAWCFHMQHNPKWHVFLFLDMKSTLFAFFNAWERVQQWDDTSSPLMHRYPYFSSICKSTYCSICHHGNHFWTLWSTTKWKKKLLWFFNLPWGGHFKALSIPVKLWRA